MPNWVFNTVTITAETEAEKDSFKEQMAKPHQESHTKMDGTVKEDTVEEVFSFWNLKPPPKSAIESGEYFATHGFSASGVELGHSKNNWYEFNYREWGTKWDACYSEIESENKTTIAYNFSTAWSAPEPIFKAIRYRYPNLHVHIHYQEESGWGSELESDEEYGYTVLESWDIPSSHAEYVGRDQEDNCVCAYEMDEEELFSDCPRD